jgi:NADPH:quinone reductase
MIGIGASPDRRRPESFLMRAILVTTPGESEVLQLVEAPEPTPAAGEVTIDVAYAGVGLVDTLFRRGVVPLSMPLTPGIEVSGR